MESLKNGFLVGAIGDLGLQVANANGVGNEGLKAYFAQYEPLESMFYAGALTGFWAGAYEKVFGEGSLLSAASFAAALDIFYRFAHPTIYPTLDTYYEKNSFGATIAYNVVTMTLVRGTNELL